MSPIPVPGSADPRASTSLSWLSLSLFVQYDIYLVHWCIHRMVGRFNVKFLFPWGWSRSRVVGLSKPTPRKREREREQQVWIPRSRRGKTVPWVVVLSSPLSLSLSFSFSSPLSSLSAPRLHPSLGRTDAQEHTRTGARPPTVGPLFFSFLLLVPAHRREPQRCRLSPLWKTTTDRWDLNSSLGGRREESPGLGTATFLRAGRGETHRLAAALTVYAVRP